MKNNPRGPQATSPGPATPLSAARAAILDLLRAKGRPSTVEELARETRQHPNTVREHLEALVGVDLAELSDGPPLGEGRPGRRGRPAKHYRAASPAIGSSSYAGLAAVLAGELARLAPDPQAAGAEAGRSWARQTLGEAAATRTAADARRRVLAELDELGFGVDTAPDPAGKPNDETVARLVTCPLLSAARDQPGVVCSVHAGLVEESLRLLGHPEVASRLEPFAEPGACLLTIGRA
ncbi:helix-turn-helix domain-containing protein [Sinomonas notoginsengisoli]|uniref:helix-turn-helix transcriptional regulator n=1 Tax=Sinomonas notoginsengisoli TaxID=1457311 RepID=UPI001F26EBD1|nr:helix-turn-helix domain-containing protein [Sinomonas notoginsengisoli]